MFSCSKSLTDVGGAFPAGLAAKVTFICLRKRKDGRYYFSSCSDWQPKWVTMETRYQGQQGFEPGLIGAWKRGIGFRGEMLVAIETTGRLGLSVFF